jgi:hypothetical protein
MMTMIMMMMTMMTTMMSTMSRLAGWLAGCTALRYTAGLLRPPGARCRAGVPCRPA